MTIYEKLSAIQQQIKAPKNLTNKFGGYNYRNAEGILEAVKPFEEKYNVLFLISDEVQQIGDRYYVKARVMIRDTESDSSVSCYGYARESETKKGMDDSQITGAASSYARKYALNGLLLLDDTKDADSDEDTRNTGGVQFVTAPMVASLKDELNRVGKSEDELLKYLKVTTFEQITIDKYKLAMDMLTKQPDAK